jgi:hypothetical protein
VVSLSDSRWLKLNIVHADVQMKLAKQLHISEEDVTAVWGQAMQWAQGVTGT